MGYLEDSRGLYLTSKRLLRAAPAGDVLYWVSGCSLKYHLPKLQLDGHTLSDFAMIGNMQMVKYLCETDRASWDLDEVFYDMCTAASNAEIAEYLIQQGVDVTADSSSGVLQLALETRNVEMLDLLIRNNVPIDDDVVPELSEILIEVCRLDVFKRLYDICPEAIYESDMFELACAMGRIGFVRLMVARGADIMRDNNQAIRSAYTHQRDSVVNYLRPRIQPDMHAPGF
jgi:hypothetical protein